MRSPPRAPRSGSRATLSCPGSPTTTERRGRCRAPPMPAMRGPARITVPLTLRRRHRHLPHRPLHEGAPARQAPARADPGRPRPGAVLEARPGTPAPAPASTDSDIPSADNRAQLPRTQARPGPGPFRRPLLERLAPPRHPGHRRPRVPHRTAAGPKSRHTQLTLHQILDALQDVLRRWTGICTTCRQPLPSRTRTTPRPRQI